jgi:hypothetical protein
MYTVPLPAHGDGAGDDVSLRNGGPASRWRSTAPAEVKEARIAGRGPRNRGWHGGHAARSAAKHQRVEVTPPGCVQQADRLAASGL